MNFSSLKPGMIVLTILCSSCATTTKDFKQIDPDSIAVVIGYKFTAKESIHPALRTVLAFTAQMLLPITSVATFGGNILAGATTQVGITALGNEKPMTVEEAINDLVYKRVECSLRLKGYKPTLKLVTPVEFSLWTDITPEQKYFEHIANFYNFDQASLDLLNADTIFYIEYELSVYAKDTEIGQPLALADLQIDSAFAHIYAMSKPPANLFLFGKGGSYGESFTRANIYDTVNGMIWLGEWPIKGAVADRKVPEQCMVNNGAGDAHK